MEEISFALDRSRRFILVISPQYTDSVTASTELDIAMDRFSDSSRNIIPVLFQDVTDEQVAQSKVLSHVIKSCIQWKELEKERFFKELQLRMPPRRRQKRLSRADGLVLQEVLPDGFARQFSVEGANGVLRDYEVLDDVYPVGPQRKR